MIIVDGSPTFLADPFTTQIVARLGNHFNQHGYGRVLQELTAREFIRDLRADGICVVLFLKEDDRFMSLIRRSRMAFNCAMPPDNACAPAVRRA
jgi:hypothetical protein